MGTPQNYLCDAFVDLLPDDRSQERSPTQRQSQFPLIMGVGEDDALHFLNPSITSAPLQGACPDTGSSMAKTSGYLSSEKADTAVA
jgi:hypothetical protein